MATNRLNILLQTIRQKIKTFWDFITGKTKRIKLEQAMKEKELCAKVYRTFNLPDVIEVTVNNRPIPGLIVGETAKNYLIELPNGNRIKRHKDKHIIKNGFVNHVKKIPREQLNFQRIRNYVNG